MTPSPELPSGLRPDALTPKPRGTVAPREGAPDNSPTPECTSPLPFADGHTDP
jgi:hypothetical protein